MAAKKKTSSTRESAAEITDLKRLAAGIIRSQGNLFIKELLRKKKIPIGTKKSDLETNLTTAIETGTLRLTDVEAWLDTVEGWGNQHVYLYNLRPALAKTLTRANIETNAKNAGHTKVLNASTTLQFPETPILTSISFEDDILRIVWQESSPYWTPVPEKDFQKQEGLDLFEYRAYRATERRAITRFEAHPKKGIAALFVAYAIQSREHAETLKAAKTVIGQLLDFDKLNKTKVDISTVSRNLDQENLPNNNAATPPSTIRTQKSKLTSGGAYVEFGANSKDKAFWQERAVLDVRNSVKTAQLDSFSGTEGIFIFRQDGGDSGGPRDLRVQLYGKDNRVRLHAQMGVEEVWTILKTLQDHQK